jgi:hypothetical protein
LREDSLEQIGKEFKIAKYSSLSSVVERMKAVIAKDRRLRKRVWALKEEVNMSQEPTPSLPWKRKAILIDSRPLTGDCGRGICGAGTIVTNVSVMSGPVASRPI